MSKNKEYGYDIENPFDLGIVLDLPYSQLNKRGRKAKRKQQRREIKEGE